MKNDSANLTKILTAITQIPYFRNYATLIVKIDIILIFKLM